MSDKYGKLIDGVYTHDVALLADDLREAQEQLRKAKKLLRRGLAALPLMVNKTQAQWLKDVVKFTKESQ